jgi:diguanylate cyclase (GGDEF)-like protein
MMPASVPDGIRGWASAAAAITFLTVLTGLTDGLASPFTAGFFLVVGASALSRDGSTPVVLALVAGLAAGAAALLAAPEHVLERATYTGIVFQLVALLLLAVVGAVAGREQRRARDAALRLARFDPLTGLYNRAHFFTEFERELRLSQRAGRSFALLMVDLDGLKPVNDSFGHHYGDQLLQAVTQVIQHTVRTTDTPARYGGDEFVVLLPDTDAAGAFVVAEKLRRDIAALSVQVSDRTIRTSVSIGLVAYPDDGSSVDELMAAADAALYEAKRGGRDRIVGYTTRTERVATRMGATDRRPVGPAPRSQEPPPPSATPPPFEPPPPPPRSDPRPPSPRTEPPAPRAQSSTPPPPPSSSPRAPEAMSRSGAPTGLATSGDHAPWETGMDPGWPEPPRTRVAMPVEPDESLGSRGPNARSV